MLQDKQPNDLIARFGGEEFVLLVPSTPIAGGQQLQNSLLAEFLSKQEVAARSVKRVQDVTADRQAQASLREVEERLRLAGRATNDAVWDWNFRDDHVTWNIALEHAYGHRLENVEPTGEWWLDHIHPDDRQRVDDHIHAVIASDRSSWSGEYRFLRADGSYAVVRA